MHAIVFPALLCVHAHASGIHWKPSDDAIRAYDRGAVALEDGRLEAAQRRLTEALDIDPDCGACAHALAVTTLRQDDAEEAVERLQELARRHPERAAVMVSLADAAFGSQDFALSIEAAGIALVLDATRWEALTAMVRACLRTGELDEARRWMDSASGAHPDDRLACLDVDLLVEQGDPSGAAARLDKCERSGDEDLIAHGRMRLAAATGDYTGLSSEASRRGGRDLSKLSQAFAAYDEGSYRRAATLLRQVVAENPADAEAALLLGLSEHHDGNSDRAVDALALAFDGEEWIRVGRDGSYRGVVTAEGARVFEARLRQGVGLLILLHVERGEQEQASDILDRAKMELGGCAEIDAGRIALLAARGEPGVAALTASRALAEWPGVPLLEDTVRDLLVQHPTSRSTELLDAATTANMPEGGYWKALGLRDTGEPGACIDAIEPTLPLADDASRPSLLTLAWACAVEAEELDAAGRYRAELAEVEGNPDPDVSLNHVRLLLGAERWIDAQVLLEQLDPTRPDRVDYARSLGLLATLGLGDLDGALAVHTTGVVHPEASFELALALLRTERLEDAEPLLNACCSTLEDPDQGARCTTVHGEVTSILQGTR